MDFYQLLAKMQQLDQPVPETSVIEEPNEGNQFSGALKAAKDAGQDEFEVDGKKYKVKEDGTVEACGDMGPMPPMDTKPDTPPPSMNVSMNAQGMDSIEDLLKLITKVNPDMDKPALPPMPMPTIGMAPDSMSMKPSLPPLKMLPDFDKEEGHMEPDGDEGPEIKGLDRDGDGDHDMKDHDLEKKDKEEGFANGTDDDTEPQYKDTDYMMNKLAGGLGRQQSMHKHSYKQGDNPMAMETADLRAKIRAELLQRLAEAKGAK